MSYLFFYFKNRHQRTPIGEINLKGHWLIKAGVEIDSPVKVRVMDGYLVLTSER
ncbi:conserved domain protein [Teredinibacter turnerae T7901]|uniref:Conserved domain protein n=2 Tax=Teredinibacter turnerae TaxID=2426 RepID=C5BKS6_TERTT|nr:conserved domain protein [Teredinibacter turnerae T7901]